MKFDLCRPCAECPFRTDRPGYLTRASAQSITDALIQHDQTFACHKTVDYSATDAGEVTSDSQHCAGALLLLERLHRPNQMMRIAERPRCYDRSRLDANAPVFSNATSFVNHHARAQIRKPKD